MPRCIARMMVAGAVVAGVSVLGMNLSAEQSAGTAAKRQPAPAQKPVAGAAAGQARTGHGQPDISGVWGSDHTGAWSLKLESTKYLRSIGMPVDPSKAGPMGAPVGGVKMSPGLMAYAKGESLVVDPPDGIIPYQPWALERKISVMKGYLRPAPWQVDSQTRGWPSGIPREHIYSTVDGSIGGPIQILQLPGSVVFLHETHHEFRVVPLDGRPQPGKDIKLWMGSSRGRWEGDTLVIETANNNDSSRLSVIGDFRSDEMRVTERWTIVDKDTMQYRATMEDPKVFTRPWTLAVLYKRAPAGTEIMEYAGVEGDRDATQQWDAK